MKKAFALVTALVLAVSLAACGGGGGKNGTFTAKRDEAFAQGDGRGWVDVLVVKYENDKIVEASFDAEYTVGEQFEIGTMKSSLTAEDYPMTPPVSEWIPQIGENIVKAGKSDSLDAVAGATSASTSAKTLFEAIEKNGKAGETIVVP